VVGLVRRFLCAMVALSLVGAGSVFWVRPSEAADRVPAQFVAKLYSEALGRIPDAGGWTSHLNAVTNRGCNAGTIRDLIREFYTSGEFLRLDYDNQARVLALYRGALNREPEQSGLDHHTAQLDTGELTWSQLVDGFVTTSELSDLASTICGPGTSYHFGTQPAPNLTPSGSGFGGGTGAQLQALLDAAPAGGTVYLAQKAVVRLTTTLDIPKGRTLATRGLPAPSRYAMQGRLVRSGAFAAPMVQLESGAQLRSVWVDGQRGSSTNFTAEAINIQAMGGDGTAVIDSKISNSQGWSSLLAFGSAEGWPCASMTIKGNLITAYSSEHFPSDDGKGRWTDGASIACEHATVENNAVIDATDVGIVLFRAAPAVQSSAVRNNQVLNAGNSAYGALAVDGLYDKGVTQNFTGATVNNNAFWTGPDTHVDFGMAIGTRPWFGNRSDAGTGVTVRDNTTNGLTAVVGTGIAISGMYRATVQGNDLRLSVQSISSCPHVALAVDADGYAADSDVQPGGTPVKFTSPSGGGCIGH
jgi:hypothetical protein